MNDILVILQGNEATMLRSALINVRGVPFATKPDISSYGSIIERLRLQSGKPLMLTPCEINAIIAGIRAFASEFGQNVSTYTGYKCTELLCLASKLESTLPKVSA